MSNKPRVNSITEPALVHAICREISGVVLCPACESDKLYIGDVIYGATSQALFCPTCNFRVAMPLIIVNFGTEIDAEDKDL